MTLNNQVELSEFNNPEHSKNYFKQSVARELTDMENMVGFIFNEELNARKFINFGFDFVNKKNTNEFYFFDINLDNFSWQKIIDGQLKLC